MTTDRLRVVATVASWAALGLGVVAVVQRGGQAVAVNLPFGVMVMARLIGPGGMLDGRLYRRARPYKTSGKAPAERIDDEEADYRWGVRGRHSRRRRRGLRGSDVQWSGR